MIMISQKFYSENYAKQSVVNKFNDYCREHAHEEPDWGELLAECIAAYMGNS